MKSLCIVAPRRSSLDANHGAVCGRRGRRDRERCCPSKDRPFDRAIGRLRVRGSPAGPAKLIKLGFDAFDVLSDAETNDDPEIAMQAAYLVRLMAQWTREGDPRHIEEILKDYDIQPEDRRLLRIKQLAELAGDDGLEWLCRLVRFEKSPLLSKQAALAIMSQPVPSDSAAWGAARPRSPRTYSMAVARPRGGYWLTQVQSDPAGPWTSGRQSSTPNARPRMSTRRRRAARS